ncbi:hypothetical protein VTP01DRAFT_5889 [Rhizomucor pusillus]|uniref:uncharacterized protein n=1 Tax=Rhizomucor pusillus TaxID=4840 RepID=UPI0037423ED7
MATYSNNVELPNDPDVIFTQASVAEVRGIEKRTRKTIEKRKQELRAMVGEQYLDLISAADAIIAMSKDAVSIQGKLENMQNFCNVSSIRQKIEMQTRQSQEESGAKDQRTLYILAALIKSLADVPEQIWRSLEHHRYLEAAQIYTVASALYEYLEIELDVETLDINAAFPVIQRQWDAVSFFLPLIIQRATNHLRQPEQDAKKIAETMSAFILLEGQTYSESLQLFFEARMNAIKDTLVSAVQHIGSGGESLLIFQLREIIQIVQRTTMHAYEIFVQNDLLTQTVEGLEKSFAASNTSSLPAITQIFSPSTNVLLLLRYLPDSLLNYNPRVDAGVPLKVQEAQLHARNWLRGVEQLLKGHLPSALQQVESHRELVDVEIRIFELLETGGSAKKRNTTLGDQTPSWKQISEGLLGNNYSVWDAMFREAFNNHAKRLIDENCKSIIDQVHKTLWPRLVDKDTKRPVKDFYLTLPIWSGPDKLASFNLSDSPSNSEIKKFKQAIAQVSHDHTFYIDNAFNGVEDMLAVMRRDMESYSAQSSMQRSSQYKPDIDMILEYFQDECFRCITRYASELRGLIKEVTSWSDPRAANDVALVLGRLARAIGFRSKELEMIFTVSAQLGHGSFLVLQSGINRDPRHAQLQKDLLDTFHMAHESWISHLATEFAKNLSSALAKTKWDDTCPEILLWNKFADDIVLPTQATNDIEATIYQVCKEVQRVNSSLLDKMLMQWTRQRLADAMFKSLLEFHATKPNISEKGAIQLVFDCYFMNMVLQDGIVTSQFRQCIDEAKKHVDIINWAAFEPHFVPCVENFYLRQTLILGVLTRPTRDTFDKSRKLSTSHQQQQHNVLPLAPQVPRFTLLPVGHLTNTDRSR